MLFTNILRKPKLLSNKGFLKYSKNTGWLFLERVVRLTLGMFISVSVIRYLGPEQFGILSYAISFVALFTPLTTLGLKNIVIRELVTNVHRQNEFIGTAFFLRTFAAFTIILILSVVVMLMPNEQGETALLMLIACTNIPRSFEVVDTFLQSKVLSKYSVLVSLVTFIIISGLKLALIAMDAPLVAFGLVMLLESMILALGYLLLYFKLNPGLKLNNINFSINKNLVTKKF